MREPPSRAPGTAYAVKGDALIHVSSVSRGLQCGCVCPRCHMKVVARKGTIRRHHFSHHRPTACDGGLESILHLLAKELFVTLGTIDIPEYRMRLARNIGNDNIEVEALVVPRGTVKIGAVTIESHLDRIIPDVVLNPGRDNLLVEIAVTHFIERKKIRVLRRIGAPTIEIRLNADDAWRTREELRAKLANNLDCKRWIFHPNQRVLERRFYDLLRGNAREGRVRRRKQQPRHRVTIAGMRQPLWSMKESSRNDWREPNQFAEDFKERHGRYPSLQENKDYFSVKRTRRN
jgi:Competence protein CoiA-like family